MVVATVAIYKSSNEPQPLSQVAEQIVPGGKKAVLILDNGEAIDLKSTSGVELKEKDGTAVSYTHLDVYKRQVWHWICYLRRYTDCLVDTSWNGAFDCSCYYPIL